MTGKMVLLRDGEEQSLPGEVTYSSEPTSWAGFPIESRRLSAHGSLANFSVSTGWLALCVRGRCRVSLDRDAEKRDFDFSPGKLTTGDSDDQIRQLDWTGEHEVILVQLSAPGLPLFGGRRENGIGSNVASRSGFRDQQLQRLIMLMFADIKAGCPTGLLYGESLSLALIAYLSERHCEPKPATSSPSDRTVLDANQLKRVRDYIVTNLAGELTVVEMAALLHLGPNHFTVLFKNATGRTPHQYVLSERISAGRRLIESGHQSMAEIALELGFSSQSHFASSFRRATGLTPTEYAQQHSSARRRTIDLIEPFPANRLQE